MIDLPPATPPAIVAPAPACAPVAGTAALLATPGLRWLVVGELHGTAEMPARFGDLVCLAAAAAGRPLVVGVEQPTVEQAALDAWLASDGGTAARTALLAQSWWRLVDDGRTSQAMLALLDRLRLLHQAGRVARVVAFQPMWAGPGTSPEPPGAYEQRMAALVRAAAPADRPMLLLVGNLHARTAPLVPRAVYRPMAGWLPPAATVTVNLETAGGAAWGCYTDRPTTTPVPCGPHQFTSDATAAPAGLAPATDPAAAYRWVWRIGAVTASPPAAR